MNILKDRLGSDSVSIHFVYTMKVTNVLSANRGRV